MNERAQLGSPIASILALAAEATVLVSPFS